MPTYGNGFFVWGMADRLPLQGFPAGRVRIRMRHNDWLRAYVRSSGGGMREFLVKREGGYWVPGIEQGANIEASSAEKDQCQQS